MFKKLLALSALSAISVVGMAGAAGAESHASKPKPTKSIVEIASADGRFTTLLAAVGCADPSVGAALTSGDQYTVFAPTDAAFLKLKLTKDNVCTALPRTALTDILLYHVTEGRRFANRVLPKKPGRSKTIETLLDDQSFKVSHEGVITTTSGGTSTIVIPDIAATNGVIHVIDTVLMPAEAHRGDDHGNHGADD